MLSKPQHIGHIRDAPDGIEGLENNSSIVDIFAHQKVWLLQGSYHPLGR
jgi:hypothetical protein